ncbi:hypothetical protein ABZP36_009067 [Zizania latifolia]
MQIERAPSAAGKIAPRIIKQWVKLRCTTSSLHQHTAQAAHGPPHHNGSSQQALQRISSHQHGDPCSASMLLLLLAAEAGNGRHRPAQHGAHPHMLIAGQG